jgi:hypothetical protein
MIVVAVLAVGCARTAEAPAEPTRISIATGTTAGVYYPVGGALAEIFNQHVPGVEASAESTGASVENLRLIKAGDSEVALVQGDVVYDAYHGRDRFEGEPIQTYTLAVMYPNVYHAVSLRSIHQRLNLECFQDVKGRRFSVGPPGSGNEHATNLVFQAMDMGFEDIQVHRYSYAETARALREGQLDAGSWVVGMGHATLRELEATNPLHLIRVCENELQSIVSTYPFYTPFTIPAGTYSTIQADVPTISLWNLVVVSPEFSEETAYNLAKAIYENVSTIEQVYGPGAPYFTVENLANSPVPLHPGVIRYAREQGFEVPTHLVPNQ